MAAREIAVAYISIVPSAKGFGPELSRQVSRPVDAASTQAGQQAGAKAGAGLSSGLRPALTGIGTALAAVGAARFLGGAIEEAREAGKVTRLTEQVIKSTGGSAGVTAGQVDGLANKLSLVAGVDDDIIQSGENVLLTFTNVRNAVGKGNDVFDRATGLALDMSTALGTDLQGSVLQLGKALNDPIKGVGALSRVGVSFTAQQKEQIKALVETGDQLGAQKIILAEVAKEFGGAAGAAVDPAQKAQVALANLKETVGTSLMPVLSTASTVFAEDLAPAVTVAGEAFQGLPAPIQTGIVGLSGIVAVAGPVGRALGGIGQGVSVLGKAGGGITRFLTGTRSEGTKTVGILGKISNGISSVAGGAVSLGKGAVSGGGKALAGLGKGATAGATGLEVLSRRAVNTGKVLGTSLATGARTGVRGLTNFGTKTVELARLAGGGLVKGLQAAGRGLATLGRLAAANPWVIIIAGLIFLTVLVVKNWDTIVAVVDEAVGFIGDMLGDLRDMLAGIFNGFDFSDVALLLVAPFIEVPRLIIRSLFGVDIVDEFINWVSGVPDALTDFFSGLDFSDLALLIVAPFVEVPRLIIEQITGVDIVDELSGWLGDAFTGAMNIVSGVLDTGRELIGLWVGAIQLILETGWAIINTGAQVAWGIFQTTVITPINFLVGLVRGALGIVTGVIQTAWQTATTITAVAWGVITGAVRSGIGIVTGVISSGLGFIRGVWNSTFGALPGVVAGALGPIVGIVKTIINTAIDVINFGVRALKGFELPEVHIPGTDIDLGGGSPFSGLHEIPKLAKGGIVTKATLAILGEVRPEVVAPLPDLLGLIEDAVRNVIITPTVSATITPTLATTTLPELHAQIHAKWVIDVAPTIPPIESFIRPVVPPAFPAFAPPDPVPGSRETLDVLRDIRDLLRKDRRGDQPTQASAVQGIESVSRDLHARVVTSQRSRGVLTR